MLLIVGADDHVVPLGQYAAPAEAARLGDFVALSAAAAHIPRLEHPDQFLAELLPFLGS